MPLTDIYNFVPVSEELATAGQPTEDELREVAREGFGVVVNLGLLDPRYCLEDEAGLVRSLGMLYVHIPVDFKAPGLQELRNFFRAMEESKGKKVFVHCAANYRVSGFVSLYGQARLGWPEAAADAHIRRLWEPDPVWAGFISEARRRLRRSTLLFP